MVDIINDFVANGAECSLITGKVESNFVPLDHRVKITLLQHYDRRSLFKRLCSWLSFCHSVFWRILFARKTRLLFFITPPPMAPFIGLLSRLFFKQSYVILLYDLYPDALVNFAYLSDQSWISRFWATLNRPLFNRASLVYTLSESMAERTRYYAPDAKILIIPNWADTEKMRPIPKTENPFAKQHQQEDKLSILYSGNMGLTHDLESLVEAASLLKDEERVHFILIGEGGKKEKICDRINALKLRNVTVLPFQDPATIPYSIGTGDIAVVTLGEGGESVSVPSKIYYYMASGAAILSIAPEKSELEVLHQRYNFGKRVNPGHPEAIASFIREMLNHPEQLQAYKARSRKASEAFTPENAKRYWKGLF